MFATQSLLYSLGIGASKTLAASAAVNWMLKEGLGKAARMGVSTSFAQNMDSDIKVLFPTYFTTTCLRRVYVTYLHHLQLCRSCITPKGFTACAEDSV